VRTLRTVAMGSGPAPTRTWRAAAVAVICGVILAACGGASSSSPTVDPHLTAGIKAEASGNSALAVSDFLAVVKADPSDKLAWYDLGVIAHRAGQDPEAIRDYRAALVAHPTYFPALYNLAILQTARDPKGAVQLYRRALAVEPRNAAAHLNLGFLLQSQGQHAAGSSEIAKAVALDPSLASRVPVTTTLPQ
jgi:tetratricopeptide (TPR) repeat protein